MKTSALIALLVAGGTVATRAQSDSPPPPPPPPPAPADHPGFGAGHAESISAGPAKVLVRHKTDGASEVDRVEVIELNDPFGEPGARDHLLLHSVVRTIDSKTFLGVATAPVPPEYSSHLPIAANTGLLVETVEDDSPAAAAGLQVNDILTRFDDQILINPDQLAALVAGREPESDVKLTFLRKGTSQEATAKLARRDPSKHQETGIVRFGGGKIAVNPGRPAVSLEKKIRKLEIPLREAVDRQAKRAVEEAERALQEAERSARKAAENIEAAEGPNADPRKSGLREKLEAALKALEE